MDVPIVGLDRASAAFTKARSAIISLLDGKVTFGWETTIVANILAGGAFLTVFVPGVAAAALFNVGSFLAGLFLRGIDDAKQANQSNLNEVTAAALSDVLGIEVQAGELGSLGGRQNNAALFHAIGAKILGAITQEIGGDSSGPSGPGERAAETFLGRGVNFAMVSSVLAVITEMASVGFFKEFAEIGEQLEHAIGFGRLMRIVLAPLLHAKVVLPYTREVNAKYSPVHLSAAEYLTAQRAGRIPDDQVNQAMAEAGFSADLAAELRAQHLKRPRLHEVDLLIRWGKLTQDQGLAVLVADGITADVAQQMLDSLHLAEADREERAYAAELVKLAQDRMVDVDTYGNLIDRLHLADEEKQGIRNRIGLRLDSYKKPLTIGELIYLTEHNLITGDEVLTWAQQQGYDPTGQQEIDVFVTEKVLEYQAAQAAKAAKAAAAAAKKKGTVPPPKG